MAIIQISQIQQRTGNLVDLPQLNEAEFGWATDTRQLFIGKTTPAENIEVITSYSSIAFDQITGAIGNLNITASSLMTGEVLAFDGTNWVNAGGPAGGLITLGDVDNVKITGGLNSYVLQTDGLGNLSWTAQTGGGGGGTTPPAGSSTQIQYNNSGAFGSSANFTFNSGTNLLTVNGNAVVGNLNANTLITGSILRSNIDIGTPPLVVISSTRVSNLNVDHANVSDYSEVTATSTGTGYLTFVTSSVTGNYAIASNSAFRANLANGALIATTFVGNFSGDITGNLVVNGNNTDVLFNDSGNANATGGFTFNKTSNLVTMSGNLIAANANLGNLITANYFSGRGNLLSNIQGANVSGAVSYATTANSVAGANVAGAVSFATTANAVAGANVSGAVAYATTANAVAGANVSGTVANATHANAVAGANVSGAVSLATFATTANSVAGANVVGAIPLATYATTANSVAGANVVGAIPLATYATTANAVAGANVAGAVSFATTANAVAGANVSGTVANATHATIANTANAVAGANVSGTVASATAAGSVQSAVTFSNSGTGAASGTTFNGSAAQTISYNTVGALATSNFTGTNQQFAVGVNSAGYQKLPGGIIMQWGTLPAQTDSAFHAETFAGLGGIAFPSACLNIQLQPYLLAQSTAVAAATTSVIAINGLSAAGFSYIMSSNWNLGSSTGVPLYWFAIGY